MFEEKVFQREIAILKLAVWPFAKKMSDVKPLTMCMSAAVQTGMLS